MFLNNDNCDLLLMSYYGLVTCHGYLQTKAQYPYAVLTLVPLGNSNIGINHGFQCSNIRWITRKVFEHKVAGRVFKPVPSDPANV